MPSHDLESVALTLVAEGKGILAADETVPTVDEAIRHTRDPVDRAKPVHLPGNAVYLAWRRRVHQRRHHV